ncbi:helix-turn-helix domain-containing protein [Actinomadura rifamycini]|uniref:PucR family transcriptional regulator n=1 Tax=Actinomadura rifamycini TaxID=31962 RepID=UPI000407CAC8|nr:PucR family transcriptional regulator [Actinomadura rifamycini]
MASPPLSVRRTRSPLPCHAQRVRIGDLLRPHLDAVVREIAEEIRRRLPAYAHPADSVQGRQMVRTIATTVRGFVDSVDDPAPDWSPLTDLYAHIGAREASGGHGLDGLEAALRLSSRITCRRFIGHAYDFGWSRETLAMLTEAHFGLLAVLVDAAAEGYASAREELATRRERDRGRLRDVLVADPPIGREAIRELAKAADWTAPETICAVALRGPLAGTARLVPPTVLADWSGDAPYLVVPDPDGPGQDRLMAALADACPGAAVGPTVPVDRGAVSLRWARRAVALAEEGVLPADGTVRCCDHLATLVTAEARDLVEAAAPRYLRPLLEQPPPRREMLAETLLAYFNSGCNAVVTGRQLHIHPQTVRYRIRVINDIFGGEPAAPETKLATMIALNSMLRIFPDTIPASPA